MLEHRHILICICICATLNSKIFDLGPLTLNFDLIIEENL